MKYILLLFIFLSCFVKAQPPGYSGAFALGGSGSAGGYSLANDILGNVFIVGSFTGAIDADPSPSAATLTSSGSDDAFIAKYNNSGAYLWGFSLGSSGVDIINSVTLDNSGDIILTGQFNNTVDFDPSPAVFNLTAIGNGNAFVSKYNSSGSLVWAFAITTTAQSAGNRVVVDVNNSIVVTGKFSGVADFDPTASTFTASSINSTNDIFIAKYSATGNLKWVNTLGGTQSDNATSLAIQGNQIYAGGTFQNSMLIAAQAGTLNLTSNGGTDCFIAKLDTAGVFQWAVSYGNQAMDECADLTTDVLGNVYACGPFSGTVDFNPASAVDALTSASGNDIYLLKLTGTSNFQWVRKIGGTNQTLATALSCDQNKNVYMTGRFTGITDFDPSANTFTLGPASGSDIYVAKYNSTGNMLWAFYAEGPSSDIAFDVSVDANDVVRLTGAIQDSVDFDFTPGTSFVQGGSVYSNVFLAKYSQMPCSPPPTPTHVTSASNTTFCANTSGTLVVNGAGSISWFTTPTSGSAIAYGDTLLLSLPAAATYSYYAEANTCATSASREQVTFTVLPQPAVSAINSGSICTGESATLTASGANSYSWSVSLTGNQIIVSPLLTTTYSVTGTNNLGCSHTAVTTVTVETCAGITESFSLRDIDIYPNPSAGTIFIDCNDSGVLIEAYDALSKLILKHTLEKGRSTIEKLPPGIIFLRCTSQSQTVIKRIIVM